MTRFLAAAPALSIAQIGSHDDQRRDRRTRWGILLSAGSHGSAATSSGRLTTINAEIAELAETLPLF